MTDVLTGTEHFTLAEVEANTEWPIPDDFHLNAQLTLEGGERLRATLGVPIVLTSLWRSETANAALPGSVPNSRHLIAGAMDGRPEGITLDEAARRFAAAQAAGTVSPFDQLLVESDHLHYDPGGAWGYRNEALVADVSSPTGWTELGAWAAAHPAVVAASAVVAGLAFRHPAGVRDTARDGLGSK